MELSRKIKMDIKTLANASDQEVCGFIIQDNKGLFLFPCKNMSQEPKKFFEISLTDYLRAEKLGSIEFVYHSHIEEEELSDPDIKNRDGHGIPYIFYCKKNGIMSISYPKQSKSAYEKYLGRIFELGVSDCFSIIRDFYNKELGIQIRDEQRQNLWFQEDPYRIEVGALEQGFSLFGKDTEIKKFDILIFSNESSRFPRHFGIYLGGDSYLHQPMNMISRIDRVSQYITNLLYIARKE